MSRNNIEYCTARSSWPSCHILFNPISFVLHKPLLNKCELVTRSICARKGWAKYLRTWSLSQTNSTRCPVKFEAGVVHMPVYKAGRLASIWLALEVFSKFDEVLMITILLQPDHEMRTSGSIGSDHDPLSYRHTWLNLPVFTRTAHSCYWDIDKYKGRGGETFSDIHLYFRGKNIWCSLNRKIDGPQSEEVPESLPKTEPQQID